jgi:NYN domain-containing protein
MKLRHFPSLWSVSVPRIAVLIDADNIAAALAPTIFAHIPKLGTTIIKRVYGRPGAMTDWGGAAATELCEMRVQGNIGPAKNGTDIALAIDAMDILHCGVVDAFCVVSNDRDFVPLAIRLRASGKAVHAICKRGDERYSKAFDSVFELDPMPSMHPIVDAFRKITAGRTPELSLAETGKLLRECLPGVIPTSGKAPLRKALVETGQFTFSGTGPAVRVSLKA